MDKASTLAAASAFILAAFTAFLFAAFFLAAAAAFFVSSASAAMSSLACLSECLVTLNAPRHKRRTFKGAQGRLCSLSHFRRG